MPVLDWSSTAAWLGIFATLAISIITPAISTHLNNRFHLRLKQKELEHTEKSEMYQKKYSVYEGFLQNVGRYLQLHTRENISEAGTYLYELYLYLPDEHWCHLDSLISSMINGNIAEAQNIFIGISKILSAELKSSEVHSSLSK